MAQVTFKYEPVSRFTLVGMVIAFEDKQSFYRIYSITKDGIHVVCLDPGQSGDNVGEKYIVPFEDLYKAQFTFCETRID